MSEYPRSGNSASPSAAPKDPQYNFGDFGTLTKVTWLATCDPSAEILREDIFGTDQSDYGYNSAGLMTDVVEHATGGLPDEFGSGTSPLATRYLYRPDGQLQRVTFPDGDAFNYAYDPEGRSTGITGSDQGLEKPLISAAQYRDPVTGTLSAWTNHITLGEQP
jgi:YD repeat-containing protein